MEKRTSSSTVNNMIGADVNGISMPGSFSSFSTVSQKQGQQQKQKQQQKQHQQDNEIKTEVDYQRAMFQSLINKGQHVKVT